MSASDQPIVTTHAGNRIGYHDEQRPSKVVRHRPVSAYQDAFEVFRIDDGERHWVVAESKRDAVKQHGVDSLDYKTVEEYRRDMGPIQSEPSVERPTRTGRLRFSSTGPGRESV